MQYVLALIGALFSPQFTHRKIGRYWIFEDGTMLPQVAGGEGPGTGTLEPTEAEKRLSSLADECKAAADAVREIRGKKPEERGDSWGRDMQERVAVLKALDLEHQVLSRFHEDERRAAREKAEADAEEQRRKEGRGPRAAFAGGADEFRSAGTQFAENKDFAEWAKVHEGRGTSPAVEVEFRTLITTAQNDTASGGLFMPRGTPYIGNVDRRRLFVRQMLPGGNTTLNSVPYIQEVNPRSLETGATSVAEGTAKPEVTMQFVEADAIVRKIAAWIPVTSEILTDAPTLRSYVDARLAYMLAVAEENQILNGTGSGADLRGIRQTSGLQTQTATAGDNPATIGNAIAKIENVDLEADGLAMNPLDYWSTLIARHATRFDGNAIGGGGEALPYGTPPSTIWGLEAVRTRAMPLTKVLVGAWRLGAQILDREGVNLKTTDSHQDYFVLNKIVILAEERLALPVYRPDGFCEATLG